MVNKVLCVIPCRKGSKRLPDKTIKDFKGKPLIRWTIEQAKQLFNKNQIVINTDYDFSNMGYFDDIKECIYKRPDNLCGDDITTEAVLKEMLTHYSECEMVILLQLTSPGRDINTIKRCIWEAYDKKVNTYSANFYNNDKKLPNGECYVWWVGTDFYKRECVYSCEYGSVDINTQLDFEVAEVLHDVL